MPEKINDRREELLSAAQAAAYLSLSISMMAKMRCLGGGPEYFKFGRSVRYDLDALELWSRARRVRNTSDAARLPPRLTGSIDSVGDAPTTAPIR